MGSGAGAADDCDDVDEEAARGCSGVGAADDGDDVDVEALRGGGVQGISDKKKNAQVCRWWLRGCQYGAALVAASKGADQAIIKLLLCDN